MTRNWLAWAFGKYLSNRWLVLVSTLACTAFDLPVSIKDFQRGDPRRRECMAIEETKPAEDSKPVVITLHIFHQDQVEFFVTALNQLPAKSLVLVTTPSLEIKQILDARLDKGRLECEVRICQNRGRNFGPLLVEFSDRLLTVESFIHVHSKVSSYASDRRSREWVRRLTGLLLDVEKLRRVTELTQKYPRIGVVYSEVSDLFKGLAFRWGLSRFVLVPLLNRFGGFPRIAFRGAVDFPAGGMFWVRSEAIRPLLEAAWSYEDFPPELGQLEGTVQHGVERLIGALSSALGYQHLVHRFDDDVFVLRSAGPQETQN